MPFGAYGANLPIRLGGDAETGWAPAQHARLCADLAAVKRVAPLSMVQVYQTTSGDTDIIHYCGQNGVGLAYAPTLVDNGTGDISLTWPAYWEDEYGVQAPIKIRLARASYSTSASTIAGRLATVEIVTGRTVRVRTFLHDGTATNARFTLKAW